MSQIEKIRWFAGACAILSTVILFEADVSAIELISPLNIFVVMFYFWAARRISDIKHYGTIKEEQSTLFNTTENFGLVFCGVAALGVALLKLL